MGWYGPTGDCDCCGCDLPECTLEGEISGTYSEDVTVTWTTTGALTAVLTDDLGNELSELLNGSLLVSRGACRTFTLTATNDCGPSVCTYDPPDPPCGCEECNYDYESEEVINPQWAGRCVPCGCASGIGDNVVAEISGFPALFEHEWYTEFYPAVDVSCNGTCTESFYLRGPSYIEFDGFDVLNGTFIFELLDNACVNCSPPQFRCYANPYGYYLGTATITNHAVTNRPECADTTGSYVESSTFVIEVELAISFWQPIGTGLSTTFPAGDGDGNCYGFRQSSGAPGDTGSVYAPFLWYRVVSSTLNGSADPLLSANDQLWNFMREGGVTLYEYCERHTEADQGLEDPPLSGLIPPCGQYVPGTQLYIDSDFVGAGANEMSQGLHGRIVYESFYPPTHPYRGQCVPMYHLPRFFGNIERYITTLGWPA